MMNKQSVRSKYLAKRNALGLTERKEKSLEIIEKLKSEACYIEAEAVLLYMDYRSEVMTTTLAEELFQTDKQVFAPRVKGFDIVFYEIHSWEDLEPGYQGIREPIEKQEKILKQSVCKDKKCLLLVPGAVFDRERCRMGYGKGFYDRFLSTYGEDVIAVGLAFSCQLAKSIPTESHDRKMNMIITESEVIRA